MTTTSSERTLDDAAVDEAAYQYLEDRHARERARAEGVAERFPALEDVLSGKSTLITAADGFSADGLRARYDELELHPKGISGGKEYLKQAEAYVKGLTSYVGMMEALSGTDFRYDEKLMLGVFRRRQKQALLSELDATDALLTAGELGGGTVLLFIAPLLGLGLWLGCAVQNIVSGDVKNKINDQIDAVEYMRYPSPSRFFDSLSTAAKEWDGTLREAYALEWYHTDRPAFEKAYRAMGSYGRAHVERAFSRMLGSGCLDMDEKQKESYLASLEPEEKPLFSQLE